MIITASQPRITVTAAWTNIVAGNGSLASVNVLIQNVDDDLVEVVAAADPAGKGPVRLDTGEVIEVNAAAIWVRGEGNISATIC